MQNIRYKRAAAGMALLGPLLVGACASSTPTETAAGVDMSALEMPVEPIEVWRISPNDGPTSKGGNEVTKHKGADDPSDRSIGTADGEKAGRYPGEIFDIVWHCHDTDGGGWPTVGECIWQHEHPF
ncbi:MAG: hypothetical protein ACFCVK_08790 [Acidimicrobiales bacterium]